jgi:hypothetical protein
VSERADLLLATVLALACATAAALAAVAAQLGVHGLAGLGAVAAGIATACYLLAFEARNLPPAALVLTLAAVGSTVALLRALHAIWREQRLLRALPSERIAESPVPIDVVPATTVNAICTGFLRPRIVVTRPLLERLDPEERRAALAHELAHAAALSPLKVTLGRVTVRTFFWLPLLGDLLDRYVLLRELEADGAAAERTSRAALAGALLETIQTPSPAGAVGLADFASARIDRLFDPAAPLPPVWRRRSLAASAAAAGALVFAIVCAPHLDVGESAHLHAMSIHLVAHRTGPRLLGLAEVTATVAACAALRRRLARH